MTSAAKNSIVVLKMQPNSARARGGSFLRICVSGIGRQLGLAERELNSAIEVSEAGRRDLVPLHRLRAKRIHSKATDLQPIEDALKLVHGKAGKEIKLPIGGFFDLSKAEAVKAVEAGLGEYEKKLAAKAKRQMRAKKAREALVERKQTLIPIIENVVRYSTPHSEELCEVLDGLEGKPLRNWAEKQLSRLEKAKKAADRRSEESKRLRELAVKNAESVNFDAVTLRETQRKIAYLEDEHLILTEAEEQDLEELHLDVDGFYQVVQDWHDGLPKRLREFASIVLEEVESACPLASSFEDLVRLVLIEDWDRHDYSEDWFDL